MTTDTSTPQAASTCGCRSDGPPTPRPSQATVATVPSEPCCGTARAATEAGACCHPAAKADAVAAGATCC